MAHSQKDDTPILGVESVSAVFAHDISTPLTTAQMNAELLVDNLDIITKGLNTKDVDKLPVHLRLALEKAPQLIKTNLASIQRSLKQYKTYLNSLHDESHHARASQKSQITHFRGDTRLSILLVDDEDIHHDIGEAVLGASHNLEHEKSGEATLRRCRGEKFDVVLMDMQMPGLPGPQTAEQLRTFVPPSTMILGLTNMPIEPKKNELLECGFNGFLDKPLKLSAFNQLIEALSNDFI